MTTPTKEQIEKIAFELFSSDFGLQMMQQDWEWWNNKIKDYYRHKATVAILEWEKIRNSPKQVKIWEDNNASFEGISCL